MSALNITCSGAVYHGCATLEVMRYRCPQWQPGNDMPVNDSPEGAEEPAEDVSEDEAPEAPEVPEATEAPEASEEAEE
ncbi:hypothetical protein JKF63_02719 [Porcisia hertigi]|uniref:Uncharacterized protein n=1 Tax=Porcisia hertigi TaxID=2761500 RepID=A0A836L427_9TRYP|nr:hypothetical protein JKF63_02719 [Porcisia hertigi]